MNNIIRLPSTATAADFGPFLASGEVTGNVATTDSGKRYVEAAAGQYTVGQTVVRFVRATDPSYTGRRSSAPWFGWSKEVVGTVSGSGKAFIASTKEAAALAGDENPADVYHARFYIEG